MEKLEDQFRDPQLDISGEVVGFYPREYYPFDNFAPFQVYMFESWFPTAEHLYHYCKFMDTDPNVAERIFQARSAHDAFKLAQVNKGKVPADWGDRKVAVMEEIVRAKLSQHYYIQQKLLATGEVPIVEDSPKDSFWGWGPDRQGRNELGKIWMKLRSELRLGAIALLPEPDYTE